VCLSCENLLRGGCSWLLEFPPILLRDIIEAWLEHRTVGTVVLLRCFHFPLSTGPSKKTDDVSFVPRSAPEAGRGSFSFRRLVRLGFVGNREDSVAAWFAVVSPFPEDAVQAAEVSESFVFFRHRFGGAAAGSLLASFTHWWDKQPIYKMLTDEAR
jgi:hypothetical protein